MVRIISSKEYHLNFKGLPEYCLFKTKYYLPNGSNHFFTYFTRHVVIDYVYAKVCIIRHKYIYVKFPCLDYAQHPLAIKGVVGQYVLDSGLYSRLLHPEL